MKRLATYFFMRRHSDAAEPLLPSKFRGLHSPHWAGEDGFLGSAFDFLLLDADIFSFKKRRQIIKLFPFNYKHITALKNQLCAVWQPNQPDDKICLFNPLEELNIIYLFKALIYLLFVDSIPTQSRVRPLGKIRSRKAHGEHHVTWEVPFSTWLSGISAQVTYVRTSF